MGSQQIESYKRLRMSSDRIIPSLPDEISLLILARLPRICYLNLKMVSPRWKEAVTVPEIFRVRKELGRTEEWLYVMTNVEMDKYQWHALDPLSRRWQRLPPMPNFFFGPAIGSVNECLYVLGGFSGASAINCVWRYDPRINQWQEVSSMNTCRAFCNTAQLNNKLYVVGGSLIGGSLVGGRHSLTPLPSEVYDPHTDLWTQLPSMPFSKSLKIATAFSKEPIGMTSYRGRLCVPQGFLSQSRTFNVGGEIYDPEADSWVDMSAGMVQGWPAIHAWKKLGVVVDGELYAMGLCPSSDNDKIKRYDAQEDTWKGVGRVPFHDSMDSFDWRRQYLLAGLLGKLHVLVMNNTNNEVAVLQADLHKSISFSGSTSSTGKAETDVWKFIDAKNIEKVELVGCQVLEI